LSKHIGKLFIDSNNRRGLLALSADFQKMVEVLLSQKPEISAEQIRDMIDEKKRKIGAGYLTDQGALFLVAADLGISFENIPKSQSGIKDLYIGAKDVTVTARIMNIYPIRKFMKKDTNEESRNRTLTIYDKESSVKLKLWDNQTSIPDEIGLKPGDLVKISQGYVKSGLDGKPTINLGSNGIIEKLSDDDNSPIPNIDTKVTTVDEVREPQDNVVIVGKVKSNPRISEFTNIRGQQNKSLQMQITNEDGSRTLRVVIWNVEEERIPKVFNTGARVKLVGVRIKQSNPQYGTGDFEIHGDEGTSIEFFGAQEEIEVMPLRILSIGRESGRGNVNCLAIGKGGKFLSLTVDSTLMNEDITPEVMIECVPSRIFGTSITLSKDESYIRIIDDDPSFPKLSMLESKIKDIQLSDNPFIIEAIVLQAPNMTEVSTKTGEVVPVTDTLLGDDTGEIRLTGWRSQSSSVNQVNVGDRIKVIGATANNGREGKVELTLKPHSSIIKVG
jgi:ssDNA-binding replication factor A large subunit